MPGKVYEKSKYAQSAKRFEFAKDKRCAAKGFIFLPLLVSLYLYMMSNPFSLSHTIHSYNGLRTSCKRSKVFLNGSHLVTSPESQLPLS